METTYVKEHKCTNCFWLLKMWFNVLEPLGRFSFVNLISDELFVNEYKTCPRCGEGVRTNTKEQKDLNFWR